MRRISPHKHNFNQELVKHFSEIARLCLVAIRRKKLRVPRRDIEFLKAIAGWRGKPSILQANWLGDIAERVGALRDWMQKQRAEKRPQGVDLFGRSPLSWEDRAR